MVSNLPVILSKSLSNHMKEVKADAVSNPVESREEWGSILRQPHVSFDMTVTVYHVFKCTCMCPCD